MNHIVIDNFYREMTISTGQTLGLLYSPTGVRYNHLPVVKVPVELWEVMVDGLL